MSRINSKNFDPDQPALFPDEMLGRAPIDATAMAASEAPFGPLKADAVADGGDATIFFMSFGSGSSGNCSYVGDRRSGFLIDAGIDPVKVETALNAEGIGMEQVRGIVLTHDHGDHVRYVYNLLRNNRHMKVYCTPKILNGLLRRHSISRRIKDYQRAIYKEFEFPIGNFTLTAFEVLHDGTDNCGFYIAHGDTRMVVATDLGCISHRLEFYAAKAQFLVIESNYDREMLAGGHYPDHLKARIMAENGHLDNEDAAAFVAKLWTPALRYVFLCHLSHDNNTHEKALAAHRAALMKEHPTLTIGDGNQENLTDLQLVALPRYDVTRLYALRPRS